MLMFNVLLCGVGMHVFFSNVCPNEYHLTLINISFYIILMYSYMELQAKKLYNHPRMTPIRSFIKNMKTNAEIEVIKFNDVISSTNKTMVDIHHLLLHDFIIYSDYESVTDQCPKVNKVLYYFPSKFPFNFKYTVCKFSFISLSVRFNETNYPIKLSSDNENYYVVGNKINRLIICYLLKKQHNVLCDEVVDIYSIDLIDSNVNMKTLCEKDEIVLNENDYKVRDFVYMDTSNMTVKQVSKECIRFSNLAESKTKECNPSSEAISEQ